MGVIQLLTLIAEVVAPGNLAVALLAIAVLRLRSDKLGSLKLPLLVVDASSATQRPFGLLPQPWLLTLATGCLAEAYKPDRPRGPPTSVGTQP